MTKDEFLENIYQQHLKTKALADLADARTLEEKALVQDYKIDELNAKRAALVMKYKNLSASIEADLNTLQEQK